MSVCQELRTILKELEAHGTAWTKIAALLGRSSNNIGSTFSNTVKPWIVEYFATQGKISTEAAAAHILKPITGTRKAGVIPKRTLFDFHGAIEELVKRWECERGVASRRTPPRTGASAGSSGSSPRRLGLPSGRGLEEYNRGTLSGIGLSLSAAANGQEEAESAEADDDIQVVEIKPPRKRQKVHPSLGSPSRRTLCVPTSHSRTIPPLSWRAVDHGGSRSSQERL